MLRLWIRLYRPLKFIRGKRKNTKIVITNQIEKVLIVSSMIAMIMIRVAKTQATHSPSRTGQMALCMRLINIKIEP